MGSHNVDGLGVMGQEVQDAPALLDVGFGVGPQRVHQVNKLDAVTDEKNLRSGSIANSVNDPQKTTIYQ